MFGIKFWLVIFAVCIFNSAVLAQIQPLPLSKEFEVNYTSELYKDSLSHTAFKPILRDWNYSANKKHEHASKSWLHRKAFHESLIYIDTGEFQLTIDPVFNAELGRDLSTKNTNVEQPSYYKNTRGFMIRGNIGEKFGFTSSFYENQAVFPDYLDEYIAISDVVPGQGRTKTFKEGYDYAMASASIFYQPSEFLNIQAGNGKHFIGHGYRSLFLSDNTFNYPYFRTSILLFKKRLSYDFMFSSFQDLYRLPVSSDTEPLFKRKAGNFHYLSWRIVPGVQVGAFESTVFQTVDTSGNRSFEINALNPIIGVNSLNYRLENKHNSMIGADLKVDYFEDWVFYSQLAWGDNQFDHYALQLGLTYLASDKLIFRVEYNQVEDKTYQGNDSFQNYTHYNQYLAHPVAGGFNEYIGIATYKINRVFGRIKGNYIDYRTDVGGFNTAAYGFGSDVLIQEMTWGYIINPVNNMNLRLGVLNRNNRNGSLNDTAYIFFGFTTSLTNAYYDF